MVVVTVVITQTKKLDTPNFESVAAPLAVSPEEEKEGYGGKGFGSVHVCVSELTC